MALTTFERRKRMATITDRKFQPICSSTTASARKSFAAWDTSKKREASAAGYEQGHTWARDFARIRAGGLQRRSPEPNAEAQGFVGGLSMPYPSSKPGKGRSRSRQRSWIC